MARISTELLVFFLTFTVLMTFVVMILGIWGWALGRIWRGIPLLSGVGPSPLRPARWGALTVLAVIVLYLLVNTSIFRLYAGATGRQIPRAVGRAEPADGAGNLEKVPDQKPGARAPDAPAKVATEQTQGELMLQLAVVNTMLLLLLPAAVRLTSGATLADLGITLIDWKKQVVRGVCAAMLMIPAVGAIQSLATRVWPSQRHPVELMVLEQFTPGVALLALLSTVVLAPVIEEMLFRGIVQRWLSRLFGEQPSQEPILKERPPLWVDDQTGDWHSEEPEGVPDDESASGPGDNSTLGDGSPAGATLAIIVTSALFAAMHLPQWPAPIAIFLLSMGLGSLYQRTGSLLSAIAMHGTFNGFNTVLMLLQAIDHQMHPHAPAAHQALRELGFLTELVPRVCIALGIMGR